MTHPDRFEMHVDVRGEGAPLLLLHGFTGSSGDFRHLLDLDDLARTRRLIVPDLRGHGRTPNPAPELTHRQCAADVIALLDELGVTRCRALGVSFGGNILLHVATARPDLVEAMVIAGSPPYFPAQARTIMAMMTEEAQSAEDWRLMRERHALGDEQIRALWRAGRAFKDRHDDMAFTPPLLATIAARTLIVDGDRDPLYPVELFVEMYRAIPRASLMILPDEGHAPVFGAARDGFVRTALAFLA